MLPIRLLKKYFPNSPDWLIGGVLFVGIFWIMVLPTEIYNISVDQDYYSLESNLGFIARSCYLKGYLVSTSWVPIVDRFFEADQTAAFVLMLLGMLFSSPGYFLTGTLLATRKTVTFVSGILLVTINIIVNFYLFLGLTILLSG